jgi:hypothetical protein
MNLQENIKRILREESAKQALIQMIKDDGIIVPIQIVNGANNLIKIMGIKTPMDFLDIFDNLKPVRSVEQPRLMLYRYKEGDNIFAYDTKNNEVYINYNLWYLIKDGFDLTYFKTQEICKEWLEQKYEIKVKDVFSSFPGSEHLTI